MTTIVKVYEGTFNSLMDALQAVEKLVDEEVNKAISEVNKEQKKSKKKVAKDILVRSELPKSRPLICIGKPKVKPEKFFSVKNELNGNVKTKAVAKKSKKKAKKAVAVVDDVDYVDHFNG